MKIEHYEQRLSILKGKIQGIELSSVRDPGSMAQKLYDLKQEVEDLMELARMDPDVTAEGIMTLDAMFPKKKALVGGDSKHDHAVGSD